MEKEKLAVDAVLQSIESRKRNQVLLMGKGILNHVFRVVTRHAAVAIT